MHFRDILSLMKEDKINDYYRNWSKSIFGSKRRNWQSFDIWITLLLAMKRYFQCWMLNIEASPRYILSNERQMIAKRNVIRKIFFLLLSWHAQYTRTPQTPIYEKGANNEKLKSKTNAIFSTFFLNDFFRSSLSHSTCE